MLDKLFARFFPCEQRLKALRSDHSDAVRRNEKACFDLRIACGVPIPSDFSHLQMDGKQIVNPR